MKNIKKGILFSLMSFAILAMIALYSGCSKEILNDQPPASCSDGIKNQGESGIDCGGPCTACNALCNGNGSISWWPVDSGNVWSYSYSSSGVPEEYRVCVGTINYNANKYFHVIRTDSVHSATTDYYYRTSSSGDIKIMFNSHGPEYLFIPLNPTLNQKWVMSGDTMKVVSLTASVTTTHCIYSNLLKIDRLDSSGNITESYYLKKGLGLVDWFYLADAKLVDVQL